jgi:hypothetical protein
MKIIYPNTDNTIGIIMPCDCGMTTEQIAEKDTPYNAPYLICEDSDLPADWSTSHAWECDFSTPHGVGLGAQRYFIREAEAKIVEIEGRSDPVQAAEVPVLSIEEVQWTEGTPEDDKPALYAEYVAGVTESNKVAQTQYESELTSFYATQSSDLAREQALIAQMKAEVLQLEGVTL